MALKADRDVRATDIGYYYTGTATRGVVVCFSGVSTGSGINLDGNTNTCHIPASPSGEVALGLLLEDVVSDDLTTMPRNYHKAEQQSGEKVPLMRKGWVVTNMIIEVPATVGATAYLGQSGYVTNVATDMNNAGTNSTVGKFMSKVDESNYCRVEIDL